MVDRCVRTFAQQVGIAMTVVMTIAMTTVWSVSSIEAQRVATAPLDHIRELQHVTVDVERVPLLAVLHTIARQAKLVPAFNETIIPATVKVTLHVHDMPAVDAFQQVLRGTGLMASVHATGDVAIVREANVETTTGVLVGRVTDAKSRQPLRSAKVGIDGVERVTETADDGTFRVADASIGSHTLTIKLLGYAKATRPVSVVDNTTTRVDIALESAVTPLTQVVVTGTVIPTERKAVSNAITVITARQIEELGITRLGQLFRGNVPGVFAQNQGSNPFALLDEVVMYSRGATSLNQNDLQTGLLTSFTNPIKTYIDGIELANSKYLSQIDPRSIERIEILTGPQASTIYGSNALNGVMQIFTKRGSRNTPQLALNLLSGWVENNFSSARTPQHDYSAQLSGLEGRLSYNAGGSWNYTGPWTPAKQTTRTDVASGMRLDLPTIVGRVTADVSLRRGNTQTNRRGDVLQTQTGYRETGWYKATDFNTGLSIPTTKALIGQTLGLTLGYTPTRWSSHELSVGQDASDTELRYTARGYVSLSDTTLYFQQDHTDRRSLRYTTTARVPVASMTQVTVTLGADTWQSLSSFIAVSPQALTGTITSTSISTSVSRQPGHNTGGFVQTQVAVKDRLFLTYGLRGEWNPNYGADAQPNYAPRYGVAYTQDIATPLGPVTAKLRASYGRSTRPPASGLKVAQTLAEAGRSNSVQFFGNYDYYLANPELTPEDQQGGEGGLEFYVGTHGSLVITRYNQTVDGLIANTLVDSVRSLLSIADLGFDASSFPQWLDGYAHSPQYQYLNIGTIRNQGWELQGTINTGVVTTHGTYSWTKSRTIGVNPRYRSYFTQSNYPQYQPGATFQYLPEHTWAVGITYAHSQTTVGLEVTGTGRVTNVNNEFFLRNFSFDIRLPQNRLNVSNTAGYVAFNQSYALADLNAVHRASSRVEGVLQVQNLMDRYTNDYSAQYATMGRQVKLGVRVH